MFYADATQERMFSLLVFTHVPMPTRSSYDDLKQAITLAYPKLSNQLQQIARFTLERPNDLALGTVAEAAGVQPSALIRFANALDFGGFTELQQVCRDRLLASSGSYRERIAQMRRSGKAAGAETGVLHQFVEDGVVELGQLDEHVRAADLSSAARLICNAAHVYTLGQRRSFAVAHYLAYALGQLELKTWLLDGMGGMLADSLRNIETRDVLLVISFKNYTPEVIDAAAQAHQRGVPIIAITDTALSPLKPLASVCFELGAGVYPAFRSLVAPLCLAQALVISAGDRLTTPRTPRAPSRAAARPTRSSRAAA
jgi:DNA-binding MurR/RpiR family transcriptional regulator